MRVVSESEAIREFPALLRHANHDAVIVREGDVELGAIISMDAFEIVRRDMEQRAMAALHSLGDELREDAEAAGMSLIDLEKMLDRHAT